MADVTMKPCGDCGMPCTPAEYHPYAACLMFKACHNSATVRANLPDYEALRKRCEAVEADAERYRYLRQNHVSEYESETPYDMSSPSLDLDFSAEGHDLDAAIDRVRGAAAQEPSHG